MLSQNEDVSEQGEKLMEIDIVNAGNGCSTEIRENCLLLRPVLPQEFGEGLPYAPVNWPSPGDIWGWRVGRRIATTGYHRDRYLYVPLRFQKSRRKRDGFKSKLSVEHYVRARFPSMDVNAFFSSFSWKIPSKQAYVLKDEHGSLCISSEETPEKSLSNSPCGAVVCKAGNRFCSSLVEEDMSLAAAQSCDVCCSEPGFCRECCCILCCDTIDLATGGYSYIRCDANVDDDVICGHVAHINCALRSYMAGTVGGSLGLDTEYYCRRCDTRTDLIKHVMRLLKTCESIESRDSIEKMLSIGACLLRGSQKKGSQTLLNHVESALVKLKGGRDLGDWKAEVDVATVPKGQLQYSNCAPVGIEEDNLAHQNEYLKLEEKIDQVLQKLKKSQEHEFRIAHERLHSQKEYIFSLYQQVDKEKSQLARCTVSSPDHDALLSSVILKEEHISHELSKLEDMKVVVAKGFRTSKDIVRERFDLDIED